MSKSIDSLICAASIVLCHFSVGEEGYAEWRDLADALLDVTTSTKCGEFTRSMAKRRLEEFNERIFWNLESERQKFLDNPS